MEWNIHHLKVQLLEWCHSFPIDYMHLVCLGVVRRLLFLWRKGPLKTRLPSRMLSLISESLLMLKPCIPHEFARKTRSLLEVDRWKASEFRMFLLYTGPVVLQGILSDVLYKNFSFVFCGYCHTIKSTSVC